MTVEELRDRLLEVLTEELGTYKLGKNGEQETPAIAIRHSGEITPGTVKATGLEVVIRRSPMREPSYTFGGVNQRVTWQLYLIQRPPTEGETETLFEACQKIEQAFVGANTVVLGVAKNPGVKEQCSVKIPDFTGHIETL
jgi:hypothetical protein